MRLTALLVLLPGLALAQTSGVSTPGGAPRDVTLPPTSGALVEDATATILNPAALTFTRGPQLQYFHEFNTAQGLHGNGLYMGTSAFGAVGLGVGLQWLDGGGSAFYRTTNLGLSLGSRSFSLGAALDIYAGNRELVGATSFDLGVAGRPADFLSYSLVMRNVGEPTYGASTLTRTLGLGIGVRPFSAWDGTLAVDAVAPLNDLDDLRLTYTLQAPLIPGLTVGAGVSHDFVSAFPIQAQLALTIDARSLGVTYGPGFAEPGVDQVLGVRLGGQGYPGLQLFEGSIALFDLNDLSASSSTVGTLLGLGSGTDPYLRLLRLIDAAERDPELRGIVLKLEDVQGLGLARAAELHQAVRRLRAGGKKVFAILLRADDASYLIASAADRVYAVPEAMLVVNGLSASVLSLGGSMEKLGVHWDVARQGDYKTAPEQLTRQDPSPAQLETLNALLDDNSGFLLSRIAEARNLGRVQVEAALAEGILIPIRARELGLIDEVITTEQLDGKLRELVPGAAFRPGYRPLEHRKPFWGEAPRIAIIPVLGNIGGGRSRQDPFGAQQTAGAETIISALQAAAGDPSIRAIILRIDSPGGDGLASDLIYRAVLEAKRSKPVIASMGDVAASGGYYAAMGADEIHALPTTVTGSIGVFMLKPALKGLGEKLAARRQTLKRGPLADLLDPWEPWDAQAQAAAQRWIDAFYDDFITEVATSRKLPKDRVDALARGRVWSGSSAQERGLVDQLGDFTSALSAARKRAGLSPEARVELAIYGEAVGLFAPGAGEPDVMHLALPTPVPTLPPGLGALAAELGVAVDALELTGIQARLPFDLTIR